MTATQAVRWVQDDGGREAAGFRGDARDCVVRAIAIATQQDYAAVYDRLAQINKELGGRYSARDGLPRKVYVLYLSGIGWTWTPTMRVGEGCRVHLVADELPTGRIVARLSRHLCAVVDGVVHDTHDPSRDGSRCVYGYWSPPQ